MIGGEMLTAFLAFSLGQDDIARQFAGANAQASQVHQAPQARRASQTGRISAHAHDCGMLAARPFTTSRRALRGAAFCPTGLKCRTSTTTPTCGYRNGPQSTWFTANSRSTWFDKKSRIADSGSYTLSCLSKKDRIARSGYARVGSRQFSRGESGGKAQESRPCGPNGEEAGGRGLGWEVAQALRKKGTRLVLHFDLNKTLIMVDPAGGKTQSQVLNSILAEICWGYVDRPGVEGTWSWCQGTPPSPEPPFNANPGDGEAMLTYAEFLDERFADGEGKDNRLMKEARDELKGNFSDEGQPGAGLRKEFLALEQALSLPESVSMSPLAEGAGLAGKDSYYVIPSFFRCLLALKEAGAAFGVVFRTFGSDIEGVCREHNAFCEGKHPLFPGVKMDGSDGHGDYRVRLENGESGSPAVGAFYRDEKGVALAMGTLQNPQSRERLRLIEEEGGPVYRSMNQIHDAICQVVASAPHPPPTSQASSPAPPSASARSSQPANERQGDVAGLADEDQRDGTGSGNEGQRDGPGSAKEGRRGGTGSSDETQRNGTVPRRCLALRDYYPFWRESLEEAEAGKLLTVDLSENPKVWAIMFDDNIGRPDSKGQAHIADVRNAATGKMVPFEAALRRHLVRAEPFMALSEERTPESSFSTLGSNYFLLEILSRLSSMRGITGQEA